MSTFSYEKTYLPSLCSNIVYNKRIGKLFTVLEKISTLGLNFFFVKTWWFASGWRVPPSFRPGCWARLIILILHSRTDDPMHLGTIKNRVEFWRQLHVYSAANLVNFKIACRSAIVLLLGNDVPTYLNWLLVHTIGSLDFPPKTSAWINCYWTSNFWLNGFRSYKLEHWEPCIFLPTLIRTSFFLDQKIGEIDEIYYVWKNYSFGSIL